MYIPNLIPKEHQVLIDYFKSQSIASPRTSSEKGWQMVSNATAILLFLVSLNHLFNHFWQGVLFALLGMVLFSKSQEWIEKKFRFELSSKIKTGFSAIILLTAGLTVPYYAKIDNERALIKEAIALQDKKDAEQKEQMRLDNIRRDNERMDSVVNYINNADNLTNKKQFKQAIATYDLALKLADKKRPDIFTKRANCLIAAGQYDAAISDLTYIMNIGEASSDAFIQRATCYRKRGKIEDAVSDLKYAMKQGNSEAAALYEKLNPIRKTIIGYCTRCCDGTTSGARGRGACSHHGGVCNWNDPIYQESRKY